MKNWKNNIPEEILRREQFKELEELQQQDAIYCKDLQDIQQLEERIMALDLPENLRRIIKDWGYIYESLGSRKAELAYYKAKMEQ